jgi:hypothetical protein
LIQPKETNEPQKRSNPLSPRDRASGLNGLGHTRGAMVGDRMAGFMPEDGRQSRIIPGYPNRKLLLSRGTVLGGMASFARPLQLMKTAAQGFQFPFVGIPLAFGEFQGFQHLFHIVERLLEGGDDPIHVLDALANVGRGRGALFGFVRWSQRFGRSGLFSGWNRFIGQLARRNCLF